MITDNNYTHCRVGWRESPNPEIPEIRPDVWYDYAIVIDRFAKKRLAQPTVLIKSLKKTKQQILTPPEVGERAFQSR